MMNSQNNANEYLSHQVIRIDNYEGKKFKTQQGFEPMMTKSRYMGDENINDDPYTSKSRVKPQMRENRMYHSKDSNPQNPKPRSKGRLNEDQNQGDRILTFGLLSKVEPMKSSVEYQEDVRMKN